MRIVTSNCMRELDRRAMEEGGIPGAVLMENAGRAVFEFIIERYGPVRHRDVHVACGPGNNGGDGFVVARYLKLAGAWVTLTLAADPERITGDALTHFRVLRQLGVLPWTAPPAPGYIKVDALLGTGAKGAPREEIAAAIRRLNADRNPTIAVDIPSGVDADTGVAAGVSVRATATVTFAYPKLGLLLAPGADQAGELVVSDIGFDWESLSPETPYEWIRPEELGSLLPRRDRESFKGDFGHVLVVGGSEGMSGAPAMAARAALRGGAGLVTVAAPASAQRILAGGLQEAMTAALPEQDGALCPESFERIERLADRCDALCVGPGATRDTGAQSLMERVLREVHLPAVLDADGLSVLTAHPSLLADRRADTVLTPHPGECARLLGVGTDDVQMDRIAAVRQAAERFGAVVVLKGGRTLVADGRTGRAADSIPVSLNTAGNPGLATAGSGDTLTGIIGALLGQGMDAADAARLGVYLHARSGDIAAARLGQAGMVAGDITESLPLALREFEEVA